MPDEDEIPTKPWRALVRCPACDGEGGVLEQIGDGTVHRWLRRKCMACDGKGLMTRVEAARWEKLLRDP